MTHNNAPCKDCTERHVGCHSECETYKKYYEARREMLAAYKKENELYYYGRVRNWNKIRHYYNKS